MAKGEGKGADWEGHGGGSTGEGAAGNCMLLVSWGECLQYFPNCLCLACGIDSETSVALDLLCIAKADIGYQTSGCHAVAPRTNA